MVEADSRAEQVLEAKETDSGLAGVAVIIHSE